MIRAVVLCGGLLASVLGWANPTSAYPYFACFQVASRLHQVPLDMLLAVAATESNWNPDARSDANAHGIMQIQWPVTARHLGVSRVSELYNPCLNIELGARYLRQLLDDNGGDVERSLAAYNYGPARIAGLQQLPPGALRYIATVNGHRDRINANARHQTRLQQTPRSPEVVRFDSSMRARRYAQSLGARVSNAEFATVRMPDGSYRVTINVGPAGLSMGDRAALEQLGWPVVSDSAGGSGGD